MINENVKSLWAPWRIGYIVGEKPKDCVFCTKAKAKESDDAKNLVLERGTHCFVLMNTYPYNPGHLLVVPYAHVAELSDLPKEARYEMMDLLTEWKDRLMSLVNAHGVNIGVNLGSYAGAGIAEHIHAHIVPRWIGDTNFMTTVSDTRVVSQSLEELYNTLINNTTKESE